MLAAPVSCYRPSATMQATNRVDPSAPARCRGRRPLRQGWKQMEARLGRGARIGCGAVCAALGGDDQGADEPSAAVKPGGGERALETQRIALKSVPPPRPARSGTSWAIKPLVDILLFCDALHCYKPHRKGATLFDEATQRGRRPGLSDQGSADLPATISKARLMGAKLRGDIEAIAGSKAASPSGRAELLA